MKISIGKMAKMNKVSIQCLRLYDKIGLLTPLYIDEDTKYRYYDIKQSAKIDLIQYYKSIGMSLKEIKSLFDKSDYHELIIKLEDSLEQIHSQKKELINKEIAIKRTIFAFTRYLLSPPSKTITLEYMPERKVYTKIIPDFYQEGLDYYEELLRKFKEELMRTDIPITFFYNASTTINKVDFLNSNFKAEKLMLFLGKDFKTEEHCEKIPPNMYLCIYCDDFKKELEYINLLYDEIKNSNYEVIGDYICETVIDLPLFSNNERQMYLRLQIPIKSK